MLEYAKRMETYDGEDMESVIQPSRLEVWDTRHVLVTHDECIFYSNDAQDSMWLEEGETIIKKKGQGGSLMISDFLCACHGRLRISQERAIELKIPDSARGIIKPGKNEDGWWKSEDMVEQLRDRAIPIFDALHPGCRGMTDYLP